VRGRLYPVEADWCEWRQEPPLPGAVFVRLLRGPGGRLVLGGLRIDGPPTAELLRAIPVGRIEAAANAQLAVVDDVSSEAEPVTLSRRTSHPADDITGWETSDPTAAVSRPAPGAARGRPDDFYRDIARAYAELAQSSPRPASVLAEENGVPVTTAHRWVKEARRRGFLPAGRPGKAG
jgi:hypothetical protein